MPAIDRCVSVQIVTGAAAGEAALSLDQVEEPNGDYDADFADMITKVSERFFSKCIINAGKKSLIEY